MVVALAHPRALAGFGSAMLAAVAIAACGAASTTPPAKATVRPMPSASSTPAVIGSQRTVLTQLGLNMHSDPSLTAPVVGTAAQGATLTVQDYQAGNNGWYKVQGASTTGWISADPTLTGAGVFNPYSSTERGFSALILNNWTFSEEPADVIFRPQQGPQSIVVRSGASSSAMGPEAPPGYVQSSTEQEVVCGYTGQLDYYIAGTGAPPAPASPSPGATPGASPTPSAQHLALYAAIRLRFDATHTMEIAYNYASKDQLPAFQDFYNSISFPFPLCQAPAPSASPT